MKKLNSLSPELVRVLRLCTKLPSLPSVALKVIEASKDPDISLREISAIISSDPAITAKILKVANSPMYSLRRTVNNLREALTLLGFNASLTIALSFSLHQSVSDKSSNHDGAEHFWKRSILSATIARLLGSRLGALNLEELFLAGLLQDIGILAIECITNPLSSTDDKMVLKHSERIAAEKELLGVEHSLVGAWLLKSWDLPDRIVKGVMYSHSLNEDFTIDNEEDTKFHYCLNFSGVLADFWLDESQEELLKSTMDAAQIFLGLNKVEFNQLIMDINNELPEISSLFDVTLISKKERDRVLDEARELLLERSIYFINQSENDRRKFESVSEKMRKVEKLNQLDHMTNIYNRRYIDKMLDEEYENANVNQWSLSLALIDIDNFKFFNDTHGHSIGDEVIKFIAGFFLKNIRQTDVLARYGGDEFMLLLPGATSNIAEALLIRLINELNNEQGIEVGGVRLNTTVSIGLASHIDQNDFSDVKTFINASDEALYKAKEAGRNCLVAYSDILPEKKYN